RAGLGIGLIVGVAVPALVGQADRLFVAFAESVGSLGETGPGLEVGAVEPAAVAEPELVRHAVVAGKQDLEILGQAMRPDGRAEPAVAIGFIFAVRSDGAGVAVSDEFGPVFGDEIDHAAVRALAVQGI